MAIPTYRRQAIYTGPAAERVLLVVGDVDGDGEEEVVFAGRIGEQGLWWLDRDKGGQWQPHLIDDTYPSLEAGGALFDIDGDGRLDFLGGGDYKSDQIMWWQQPHDPAAPWTRHHVLRMPQTQSHDQLIADIDGDGRAEVYFWNQRSQTLFVSRIPDSPTRCPWDNMLPVAAATAGREEGLTLADVDGDGRQELIAGLSWYKPDGRGGYSRHEFAQGLVSPRPVAADFDGDGKVEIIIAEGDASFARPGWGRMVLFHQGADPAGPWHGRTLHEELQDPHSLFVADFDGDGRPDLFVGELGAPSGEHRRPPRQRIYLNRAGELEEHVIDEGVGTHEAKPIRVGGKLGIVGKPYRSIKGDLPRTRDDDTVHLWLPQ